MRALLRLRDWPLRAKFAALLVVSSLLPLVVLACIEIRELRQRALAHAASLLEARGDQIVGQLDTFNLGFIRATRKLALLPRVIEFVQASPSDSEPLKPFLQNTFAAHLTTDAAVRGVAIVDMSGTVKFASETQLIGKNVSDQSFFQEARQGVNVISDIHLASKEVDFAPTIAFLAPIRGADGGVVGIAVMWIRASALWDRMKASNELAGPGSFAVLFDQHGIRIGHSFKQDLLFHPGGVLEPALIDKLTVERRFGENTRQLLEDVKAFPKPFERSRSLSPNRDIFQEFAPGNQKMNYGVARRFQTVPWTVFYLIPEGSIALQVDPVSRQMMLFAAGIALAAMVAGILFAAFILKPVVSLSSANASIANGDLTARVESIGADELGRLGAGFNTMAERLEVQASSLIRARDELESRVAERTAELAQANVSLKKETDERKRVDESLLLQARLLDQSHDAILVWETGGAIRFWNRGAEMLYGFSKKEAIGCVSHDLLHTSREDSVNLFLATLVRDEKWQGELRHTAKDGSTVVVEAHMVVVMEGDRRLVLETNRDITVRKHAEQALRDSQEQFRTMIDAIPQLAWMAQPDGFIFWYNRRWYEFTGTTPEQMEGWGWQRVHDPDILPKVLESWKASIATGQPFEMEFPLRAADGGFRWFLTRVVPIRDAVGHVIRWFGTNTDVSLKREAEEEVLLLNTKLERRVVERTIELDRVNKRLTELLQESELLVTEMRQTRTERDNFFTITLDMLCIVSTDGYFRRTNPSVSKTLGYSPDEFLSRPFMDFVHLDDVERTAAEALRLASGLDTQQFVNRYRCRDGSYKWISWVATPSSADGLLYCAGRDITQQKLVDLQTINSLAEKTVLLNEIHHRVKNNLQIVSSLLNLQASVLEDPKSILLFRESQNRVRSMALIHEMLYQSADLATIQLRQYIQNLTRYLAQSFGVDSRRIKIEVDVSDIAMGIDTAIPCGLIITELISNALKYAFPGERQGVLRVGFNPVENGEGYVLSVTDDGVGMPAAGSARPNSLGLKLVQRFVKQLRGEILGATRETGVEFRMRITIPVDPKKESLI